MRNQIWLWPMRRRVFVWVEDPLLLRRPCPFPSPRRRRRIDLDLVNLPALVGRPFACPPAWLMAWAPPCFGILGSTQPNIHLILDTPRDITISSVTPNPTPPCHSPRLSCPSPLQNSFLANERSPITPPIVSRKSKPRLLLSRSKTHRRSRNTFTHTNVDRLHHNVPTTLQERVQVSIGYPVDPEERIGFRFPFSPSQGGYREYQSVAFSSEFDRGDLSIDGIYKPIRL